MRGARRAPAGAADAGAEGAEFARGGVAEPERVPGRRRGGVIVWPPQSRFLNDDIKILPAT